MTQRVFPALLLVLTAGLGVFTSAQDTVQPGASPDGLPEAPGKDVLLRVCTGCHGTDQIVDTPRTVPLWRDTLDLMRSFGADAPEEEWRAIEQYLVVNLSHLGVNKAPAGDIALVFGVDQEVAQGIVDYREKQGPFKTVDDLKKAPGVDAGKIDALKPRLIFD
jgi:competence protein ComEA